MKNFVIGFLLPIGVICIVAGNISNNRIAVVIGICLLWAYHFNISEERG